MNKIMNLTGVLLGGMLIGKGYAVSDLEMLLLGVVIAIINVHLAWVQR